jgi:hypothetical protein
MAMVDAGKNMGCIIADAGDCGNLVAKTTLTPTYMAVRSCGGVIALKLSKYGRCSASEDELICRYQWGECSESEFYCLPDSALCLLYSQTMLASLQKICCCRASNRCVIFWPNAMLR